MPTVVKLILKKYCYRYKKAFFKTPLEETKNIARVFNIYFENNMLKNDARELARNVTTVCNFFCLISRSCMKYVHHTCNSQKQLPPCDLSL